jgi:hypothetical protein
VANGAWKGTIFLGRGATASFLIGERDDTEVSPECTDSGATAAIHQNLKAYISA